MQFSSTEVEASVKGFSGAIYRSCASVGEGKIRLQLFIEKIGALFAGSDPFSFVDDMILEPDSEGADGDDGGDDEPAPAVGTTAPALTAPNLPLAPNVDPTAASTGDVEYKPASNDVAESSKSALNRQVASPAPRPREGWFVAYNAVLPGVYLGV